MPDSIVTSLTNAWLPYVLTILGLIAITWAIGKAIARFSDGKIVLPRWVNAALPLLLGIAWEVYHGTSYTGFAVWKVYLVKGIVLGTLATSMYDLVLRKIVARGDKVADSLLDKVTGKVDTSTTPPAAP